MYFKHVGSLMACNCGVSYSSQLPPTGLFDFLIEYCGRSSHPFNNVQACPSGCRTDCPCFCLASFSISYVTFHVTFHVVDVLVFPVDSRLATRCESMHVMSG